MERKFAALRTSGTIYKVLGIIAGVITLLVIAAFCATSVLGGAVLGDVGRQLGSSSNYGGLLSGVFGGVLGSLVAVIYGGGFAVSLYALGEGVYLLIALEENTRATSAALQAIVKKPAEAKP